MYLNNINNVNRNYSPKQPSFKGGGEVHTRDLYANDMHGILSGFRKMITVTDRFESQKKAEPNVVFSTYLSGDGMVGANRPKNKLIIMLENFTKARAKAPGNHDFDDHGTKGLSELLDNATFPSLALNIVPKANSALQDDIDAGRFMKSKIFEENGEKFGLIGLAPSDLMNRINQQCKDNSQDIDVLNLPDTIKAVQAEVDRMEALGVNKITLLSHMGYDSDVAIAKFVNGVDVIHGAHSHDLLKGIVPGKNYFISKRGEPILITQAAKNGHWYGVSDVVYDKKTGTITKASNNLYSLDEVPDSLKAITAEQMMLGKPVEIAELVHDVKSMPETAWEENPMASFMCDAYKKLTGADIVLTNAGTMRNTLHKGAITDRMVTDMMAYYNDISTYKLSEKDVIGAINGGLEATVKCGRTGALQVAGMSYVIGKNGKVKEAYLLKDNGTKEKLNAENPHADKFFTVAYNTFLSSGSDGVEILKAPEKRIKTFAQNETDLLIEHFKSFNGKPLSIDKTGRITNEAA